MDKPGIVVSLAEVLALARLCEWDHLDDIAVSRVRADRIGICGYLYRQSQRVLVDAHASTPAAPLMIECRVPFTITDCQCIGETLTVDWQKARWRIPRKDVDIKPRPDSPVSVTDKRIGARLPSVFRDMDVDGLIESLALDETVIDPNVRFRALVHQTGLSRRNVADWLGVSLESVHNWMAPADNRRFRRCPDWAVACMAELDDT